MKAYLIDPAHQTVTAVDFTGNLDSIYRLIDARPVTAIPLHKIDDEGEADCVYIDDEGLLRQFEGEDGTLHGHRDFFELANGHFIAGRGLVVGVDSEGEDIEPTSTLDEVRAIVRFHTGLADDDPRRPNPDFVFFPFN